MNSKTENITLLWFRLDLRLIDNPALVAATTDGIVIPVFIFDKKINSEWKMGAASEWWLHHSLTAIESELNKMGSRLIVRSGDSLKILQKLVFETGANQIYFTRRYEPDFEKQDQLIEREFLKVKIECKVFSSALLFEPEAIQTQQGKPYQVFTPYFKTCLNALVIRNPLRPITSIHSPKTWPDSISITDLKLLPTIPWDKGLQENWEPGLNGARKKMKLSLKNIISKYSESRDNPTIDGTSGLSPHLHFGEISIRETWCSIEQFLQKNILSAPQKNSIFAFQRQLIWREFAHHLLVHFPHTPTKALRKSFDHFPWCKDIPSLRAWQRGQTGYPYIDAGMRQLWATGWMHNRVRMAAASFLVKHLLLPWQEGAKWFWNTLVDADLAQNTMGWQWVAGSGADAAPYFRIFNPITQSEKFDPKGEYIRKWVPELALLDSKWIHQPWKAPPEILKKANAILGTTYPKPIVEHGFARARALNAYHQIQNLKE